MAEDIDWILATWEGGRRQQHRDFHALPFREKVRVLEQLDEVARALSEGRQGRDDSSAGSGGFAPPRS